MFDHFSLHNGINSTVNELKLNKECTRNIFTDLYIFVLNIF